jgi:hypothetical protein
VFTARGSNRIGRITAGVVTVSVPTTNAGIAIAPVPTAIWFSSGPTRSTHHNVRHDLEFA